MVEQIEPTVAKARLDAGEVVLLDVREAHEVAFCRIEGSVHIPLGQVRREAPERLSKSDPVVVYCHTGVRSLMAAQALVRMGFEEVGNLAGGIEAWSLQVDPSVPRY